MRYQFTGGIALEGWKEGDSVHFPILCLDRLRELPINNSLLLLLLLLPTMEAESYPLNDIKEETTAPSSGVVSRQASDPTLNNVSTIHPESHPHQHHSSPHPPPSHPHGRTRRLSSASHVSMDFFDPEGVNELKRTLTRDRKSLKGERSKDIEQGSIQSDDTLPVQSEGTFDLEKTIRSIIRRYVLSTGVLLL